MAVEIRHYIAEPKSLSIRPEPGDEGWKKEITRRKERLNPAKPLQSFDQARHDLLKLELETLGVNLDLLQRRTAYSLASDVWIQNHPVNTEPLPRLF